MPTEVIRIDGNENYGESLERAIKTLRDGGLVGFPTETVYGVAARADKPEAVATLRDAKGRGETKPFTVHVGTPDAVHQFVEKLSPVGRRLVRKGWPGPITLVLPVPNPSATPVVAEFGEQVIDLVFHEHTVGVRCPQQPAAEAFLAQAGFPVVAASANRAGQAPPNTAEGVLAELDGVIDILLDGGRARYAKPSTVVRLTEGGFELLREGVYDERGIRRLASLNIVFVCSGNTCRSPMAEALCRQAIAERLECAEDELAGQFITVASAGSSAMDGIPASDPAVRVMAERGLNLEEHRSSYLSVDRLSAADHVFCMTRAHLEAVVSAVPAASGKAQLLDETGEVMDPFGGSDEDYRRCADQIHSAIERRVAEIEL